MKEMAQIIEISFHQMLKFQIHSLDLIKNSQKTKMILYHKRVLQMKLNYKIQSPNTKNPISLYQMHKQRLTSPKIRKILYKPMKIK